MRFPIALIIAVIASAISVSAQTPLDTNSSRVFICSYYGGELSGPVKTFRSANEAGDIIAQITGVIGLRQNFDIRSADVPNAAAVVIKGRRYILYNPKFIDAINNASGTNWAGISILAHEIGHHLNGHTLTNTGSRPDLELEADEFSGFVLHKLGATLQEAQSAMSIAAGSKASHTHPAKKDRLTAIATGWNNAADKQLATNQPAGKNIEKPTAPVHPEKTSTEVLDRKYIAYKVRFYTDTGGEYYVTIRGNLVKINGNSLMVLGRMTQSNRKGYPYMFYDNYFNYLYITSTGKIYNGNKKRIGELVTL